MGPGAGCLWGFLPVVIEGDQFPLQKRRAGVREVSRGTWGPVPAVRAEASLHQLSILETRTKNSLVLGSGGLLTTVWLSYPDLGKRGLWPQPRRAYLLEIRNIHSLNRICRCVRNARCHHSSEHWRGINDSSPARAHVWVCMRTRTLFKAF